MANQLLPLRLLASSRLFSRGAFSFHVKTLSFSSIPPFSSSPAGIRTFSVRPSRSRDGGRSGGSFRPERAVAGGGGGGRGKSLIEDEAELSDWVSDLKTDSFHLGLSSDEDDSGRGRQRISSTGKDRVGDGARVRVRDTGGFSDRRGPPRGSFSKKQRGSDWEDDEEGEKERFLSAKGKTGRGLEGLRKSGRSIGLSERAPRGSFSKKISGDPGEEKMRRGGRDGESSYKQGRGVGSLSLDTSEEEEDEDEDEDDDDGVMSGFDEDYFGDKADRKKVGVSDSFKSATSSVLGDGNSGKTVSRSSGSGQDSYLSETR